MTESGSIVGSLHYMSPEQAEGKDTDERSDIFSFGAVLYEMLTGKRAFDGETKTAILAAILKDQPEPISQFQPQVPRALDRVVRKCLEKKPAERWHSAHDLKQMLELIDLAGPTNASTSMSASRRQRQRHPDPRRLPRRKWLWPTIAAVLVFGLAAGGWEWWQSHRFTDLPLVRQDVRPGKRYRAAEPDRVRHERGYFSGRNAHRVRGASLARVDRRGFTHAGWISRWPWTCRERRIPEGRSSLRIRTGWDSRRPPPGGFSKSRWTAARRFH